MFRTILVPLDGSALAERALPFAAALTRAGGTRLVLARATAGEAEEHLDPITGRPYVVEPAQAYLDDVRRGLDAGNIAVTADVRVLDGTPAEAVLRAARDGHVNLIAMATHGRSGIGRWLYGNVADAVMRRAPVPMLLVAPAVPCRWPPAPAPAAETAPAPQVPHAPFRVLVPLDGSELARTALAPAGELARLYCGEIILLQVVPFPLSATSGGLGYSAYDPTPVAAAAREWLDGIASALRGQGQRAEAVVEIGSPAGCIVDLARERDASVIAMATHGRSGLARVVLSSVATETLRWARCPLLLVRPPALGEGGAAVDAPAAVRRIT